MRNVFLIAGRELLAYLRTPSGYFIAAAILLLDGLMFMTMAVQDVSFVSESTGKKLSADVLQDYLFWAGGLTSVAAVLLAMRLFAEERSSGTQVLLFTSPVTETQVVIAKYLSAFTLLTVITLASLYLPALIFVNGKVSIGHIAAGYLGMLLLGAASLAVGLLGSALASNQLVALILGGVMVFMLNVLSWYIAKVTEPPLSEVISHMALYMKHFHPFRRGLLQTSNVVMLLSVTYFALLTATRVLQSQRWR